MSGLLRARATRSDNNKTVDMINFAAILHSKGARWAHTLESIIAVTDRQSYFLALMLRMILRDLRIEVSQGRDREAAKRLVAIIRAKRMLKQEAPGRKVIGRMLDQLETLNFFAKGSDKGM